MSIKQSKYSALLGSVRLMWTGLLAALLVSCSLIDENMDDCDYGLYLDFKYDYNMSFGDAFASQVSCVDVYVFDSEGKCVLVKCEEGEALKAGSYRMKIELPTGEYRILCWGGMTDISFCHPVLDENAPSIETLEAMLNRDESCKAHCEDGRSIRPLFHGELFNVKIDDNSVRHETMSLKKLTKQVKVNLVNLNGEPISHNDFEFWIEGKNGRISADGARLLEDDLLRYEPYHKADIAATKGIDDAPVASAEMSSSRLVAGDVSVRLHAVRKDDGKDVLDFPLNSYLTNYAPSGMETSDGIYHFFDKQEYLDRTDIYNLTFVLNEGSWVSATISINAWSMRIQNLNL